ncbi:MAG TPA: RodZ domain-containing protein, partial [Anaerolineales bacterium]|nr:RodZ domain-containing protein [Anaerolineales bacterium]
ELTDQANEIFRSIGKQLKRQRELLGLSLDDVVRHTHLRRHYLVALEDGNLAQLPSPVQGRGMLSNYAAFLGVDPEPLLLRFADGLQSRLEASRAATPERQKPERKRRPQSPLVQRLLSIDLIAGVFLVVALGSFLIWGAVRTFSLGTAATTVAPTAPSIADVLLATETATATATFAPPTPTLPEPPAFLPPTATEAAEETPSGDSEENPPPDENGEPAGGQNVTVYITVRQRAWMRVQVDGDVVFDGRVLPGSAYSYTGEERVEVLTGNGAGLQIFFNDQDLGVLGFFGQVVERIFTLDGLQTPTPTSTPTSTATPAVTPTPERSPTPAGTLPALP